MYKRLVPGYIVPPIHGMKHNDRHNSLFRLFDPPQRLKSRLGGRRNVQEEEEEDTFQRCSYMVWQQAALYSRGLTTLP